MEKKVSILVPVYNVEPFFNRCIQSIFKQTYKNLELILVDDCSTDNSLSMCFEYAKKDKRIKVFKKESHTCLSDVRNVGIENATGEYIMFVDSDDYVCETFVEDMVNAIESNKVDVVRCKARIQKKDGSTYEEKFHGYENRTLRKSDFKELIPHLVTRYDNIACYSWALIIKKDVLTTRFNPTSYCLQGTAFFIELLLKSVSSIYFLDKPLYEYCYNGTSTTYNSKNFFWYISGLINTTTKIKTVLRENDLLSKELEQKINFFILGAALAKAKTLSNNPIFDIYKSLKKIFKLKELQEIANNVDISGFSTTKILIWIYLAKMRLCFLMALHIKIYHLIQPLM